MKLSLGTSKEIGEEMFFFGELRVNNVRLRLVRQQEKSYF